MSDKPKACNYAMFLQSEEIIHWNPDLLTSNQIKAISAIKECDEFNKRVGRA